MKKNWLWLAGALALSLFFVVGCQESANDNPVTAAAPLSVSQSAPHNPGFQFLTLGDMIDVEPSLSKVPETTISATIDPVLGGVLKFYLKGTCKDATPWYIDWKLTFPAGAVASKMKVTAVLQYDTLSNSLQTTFTPSPTTFNVPASLDIDVSGLDTLKFGRWRWGSGALSFVYVNPNNNAWELMPSGSVTVDAATRSFRARGCQVPHFSRYAFAR